MSDFSFSSLFLRAPGEFSQTDRTDSSREFSSYFDYKRRLESELDIQKSRTYAMGYDGVPLDAGSRQSDKDVFESELDYFTRELKKEGIHYESDPELQARVSYLKQKLNDYEQFEALLQSNLDKNNQNIKYLDREIWTYTSGLRQEGVNPDQEAGLNEKVNDLKHQKSELLNENKDLERSLDE